jgi:hypothetical protein
MSEKLEVRYAGEVTFFPNKKDPIVAKFDRVYGHPRFTDGKCVTSSKIVAIADDGTIETLNTIYRPQ